MSVTVPSRRSRSHFESELEDQSSESSTAANKRTRRDHGDRRETVDSWHLDTPQTVRANRMRNGQFRRQTRDSGVSLSDTSDEHIEEEHQPGAIVRVTLKDFVTYSSATFHPGPALNMIIGPNGTGKSTLVCAICLGLGWGTQHLGRAKRESEFVKHGATEATIEIELKGRPGSDNIMVMRKINTENNSHWWLNGRHANAKMVNQAARAFNIQVDNLCQFLPQDRVVEFSAMTPVERLNQTVRATADPQMIEWHEQLKQLRSEQKNAEQDQTNRRSELTNLENRQNMQRADVEKLREREEIANQIDFLEKRMPAAEYHQAKTKYEESKARREAAKNDLMELKKESAPALRALNSKQAYCEKVGHALGSRKRFYERLEQAADESVKAREKLADKVKECEHERQAAKKNDRERKQNIAKYQQDARRLENLMKEQPPSFDAAEMNERRREKTREIRDLQTQVSEYQDNEHALSVEFIQKRQARQNAEREIENLRSQAGQQTHVLERTSKQTAEAWRWIQEHRNEFVGEVFGPAIVECSVKDQTWVDAVESLFQKNEMIAITCTDSGDMKRLQDQLYKNMKLGDIALRRQTKPLSAYAPPINDQERESLGVSGWAIDYLSGPDTVLAMLCGERGLHRTGVIAKDGGEEQFRRLESSSVDQWVTPQQSYRITRRREYGNASSTRVTPVRQAQIWTNQPIDVGAENNIKQQIEEWSSRIMSIQQERAQIQQKTKDLESRTSTLEEEGREIDRDKAALQKAWSDFNALPTKLRTSNEKLSKLHQDEKQHLAHLDAITQKESDLTIEKGQNCIVYSNLVNSLLTSHRQLIEASIAHLEAENDLNALSSRNEFVKSTLESRENEVRALMEETKRCHSNAKKKDEELRAAWARNPGLKEKMRDELSEDEKSRFPEDLRVEMESLQARLDLIHGDGSRNIIKEFERRAEKISELREMITAANEKLESFNAKIKEIRDQWEPRLDTLIGRISSAFSENFQSINCEGEVSVHKPGSTRTITHSNNLSSEEVDTGDGVDFANWAIHIFVKFREDEQMSLLDSHRQSGGERAVSTVFYLMALQSLSKAPFRVVDEINQGMDPRNERVVHERMVDIACGFTNSRNLTEENDDEDEEDEEEEDRRQGGSQYFLITPKLLTGLKYSKGMKVHCIASGQYMPNPEEGTNEDDIGLDFQKLLQMARMSLRDRTGQGKGESNAKISGDGGIRGLDGAQDDDIQDEVDADDIGGEDADEEESETQSINQSTPAETSLGNSFVSTVA